MDFGCHWINYEYLLYGLFRCNLDLMKLFRRIAALLVLVAWLPATTHCLLGAVLQGAESGGCCGESHDYQHKHDGSGACGICSTLGSGHFLVPDQDFFIADFCATMWWRAFLPTPAIDSIGVTGIDSGRAPPDLARWHFLTRAALPGRSPSLFV